MGHEQMSPEKMHEHMKDRLDKLAERLEIKASQQAAWGEFAKSVGMLSEQGVKNLTTTQMQRLSHATVQRRQLNLPRS